MKCPICEKNKMKSCVYVGTTTSTLLYTPPYYDEEGNLHPNDPNTYTTNYSCSKGHKWTVKTLPKGGIKC